MGGGWAVATKSFINGEGDGGGVVMCNRETEGARFWSDNGDSEDNEDNGERVGGLVDVLFDDILGC